MAKLRKKAVNALFYALLTSFGLSANAYALNKGEKAPDFSLPGSQGTVSLASTAGSVTYVDFWASWCGPCKQSFAWMNQMQDKYRSRGFKLIGVNVDARTEDAKKFLAQTPAHFTIAFDSKGETPKNYGVKGMPTSFIIDKNGKVLLQHAGFREADREELEKQIQAALGEK